MRGQPAKIHYPDGSKELFEYHYDGSLKKKTERDGSYYLYTRDYQGRATDTQLYSPNNKLYKRTKASYSPFNLLSYTDGEGNRSSYDYDGLGRLLVERQGEKCISYAYDAIGHCCRIERKYGTASDKTTVEKREHDPFGRLTLEMTLNRSGDELRKIAYAYDINDNRIETIRFTDSGKVSERILYNKRNEPVRITDECDHVTNIVYNYRHRTPLGKFTRSKTETDPNGRVTETIVDALNRVESFTSRDINGKFIDSFTYRYDARGNKIKEFHNVYTGNKKLHTISTEWKYGPCDRLEQLTEALATKDQRITTYAYNRAGQLGKTCKANGVTLSRTYDARGLLSAIVSSDGSVNDSYVYDKEDNLCVLRDHVHKRETHRDYDHFYRVSRECLDNELESHYDYDLLDRIVSTRLPDSSSIDYSYDAASLRKVSRKDSQGKEIYDHQYLQYDLSGRLRKEQVIGNGGEQKYKRDQLGRCVEFQSDHLSWNIRRDGFDPVGNLRAIEVRDPCGSYGGNYSYDENYHLSSENGVASGEYEYDSRDNRRVKNGQRNRNNFADALIQDASFDFAYDACGNMIQKSSGSSEVKYRYDAYDRLIEVCEADNLQVLFEYDGLHRRTRKKTFSWDTDSSSWSLVSELSFLYQGNKEIAAVDTTGKIVELRVLGRGTDIAAAVAVELDGKAYLPVHDHLGSIAALVDADTNTVVESYRYSAFGEEQIFNASGESVEETEIGNPWRYSSKRVDDETGLVFFGLRYYMSETGRWITRDPAGFVDGPNLYAYVHANPMRYYDPYGLTAREFAEAAGKSFAGGLKDMAVGIKDLFIGCFADPSCNPEKSIQFAENGAALAENCAAYVQEHGVGDCLDQARGVTVDGAANILKDLKESDDKRKGEITGSVAACFSPGLIFKGLKWLGILGEGLEVAGVATKLETAAAFAEDAVETSITKSSRKRIKRLIKNISNNSLQDNGLSQEKTDQLRRLIEKAGGQVRNDGVSGVKGSSGGRPHVQTEGMGKSIDSRHIWTEYGIE
ncbi:MAG: RHS repeat-associated protein [Halioglobus sp.]